MGYGEKTRLSSWSILARLHSSSTPHLPDDLFLPSQSLVNISTLICEKLCGGRTFWWSKVAQGQEKETGRRGGWKYNKIGKLRCDEGIEKFSFTHYSSPHLSLNFKHCIHLSKWALQSAGSVMIMAVRKLSSSTKRIHFGLPSNTGALSEEKPCETVIDDANTVHWALQKYSDPLNFFCVCHITITKNQWILCDRPTPSAKRSVLLSMVTKVLVKGRV